MLSHPLLPKLRQLKLSGILDTLETRAAQATRDQLSPTEFLAILLDRAYPLWLMTALIVPVGAVLTASRLLFSSYEQSQTNRALAEQMEDMSPGTVESIRSNL